MATNKKKEVSLGKEVTKVSTSGPTQGQYGTYQYGAMSNYTDPYQKQLDKTVKQIGNYGNYASDYQKQLNAYTNKITNPGTYAGTYQPQIDKYLIIG